jgi:hypothetical protein
VRVYTPSPRPHLVIAFTSMTFEAVLLQLGPSGMNVSAKAAGVVIALLIVGKLVASLVAIATIADRAQVRHRG